MTDKKIEVNPQTEANKRWQEKNRERARYLRNRSAARNFVKKDATEEDLKELESLIEDRRDKWNLGGHYEKGIINSRKFDKHRIWQSR